MSPKRSLASALFVSAVLAAPASVSAAPSCADLHHIEITHNGQFDSAHGVASGRGTARDPYVITGCDLSGLDIRNTSKAVRIVDNRIGSLTLNYAGRLVEVHDNRVGDLRVNENIERTGAPTSGTIMHNRFDFVGQIRHFDGRFAYNTVGAEPSALEEAWPFSGPIVTFDGFNGASFDHNTLFGALDARLHGHHHSSGFGKSSHMHAMPEGSPAHDTADHARRYHEVTITRNTIHATGWYALAYLDTNHSANDRTANSETNPALDKPHVHYTRVAITRNTLIGSGLMIDVFNADDELHTGMPSGMLEIGRNTITLARSRIPFVNEASTGIDVRDAGHLTMKIVGNTVTGPEPDATLPEGVNGSEGEGVRLHRIDHATVLVDGLTVTDRAYAVRASRMTDSVRWTVRGLRTEGVGQDVAYDDSVHNPPSRR